VVSLPLPQHPCAIAKHCRYRRSLFAC
jgi:hypothetical protein